MDGHLTETQVRQALEAAGYAISEVEPIEKARHIFSHVEWDMTGYVVELETLPEETDYLFVERQRLQEEYALPTAFKAFRKWIQ